MHNFRIFKEFEIIYAIISLCLSISLTGTWLSKKDDEPDGTYHWNESDENPPSALSDVLKTSYSDCKTWNKKCKRIDI